MSNEMISDFTPGPEATGVNHESLGSWLAQSRTGYGAEQREVDAVAVPGGAQRIGLPRPDGVDGRPGQLSQSSSLPWPRSCGRRPAQRYDASVVAALGAGSVQSTWLEPEAFFGCGA